MGGSHSTCLGIFEAKHDPGQWVSFLIPQVCISTVHPCRSSLPKAQPPSVTLNPCRVPSSKWAWNSKRWLCKTCPTFSPKLSFSWADTQNCPLISWTAPESSWMRTSLKLLSKVADDSCNHIKLVFLKLSRLISWVFLIHLVGHFSHLPDSVAWNEKFSVTLQPFDGLIQSICTSTTGTQGTLKEEMVDFIQAI